MSLDRKHLSALNNNMCEALAKAYIINTSSWVLTIVGTPRSRCTWYLGKVC